MVCSTRGQDPIRRPPGAQDQQERKHADAVPLCKGRRWAAHNARGMSLKSCDHVPFQLEPR
jgi:hypothetical protein